MTIQEARQRVLFQLYEVYDNREAANIADLVMEKITGWKKIDRILNKQVRLSGNQLSMLNQYLDALLRHKPVQYILEESWFGELKFYVNKHVLIPRPETEELVDWIVREVKAETGSAELQERSLEIFDIGTGSGCIAVTLKTQLPQAVVSACDSSADALEIANQNAISNNTSISFFELDFLDESRWPTLPCFDVIVSNPPYIPLQERNNMNRNVIDYEPHLALFVKDEDPLLFYQKIADFGNYRLNPNGKIFVEIHENLANETQALFKAKDFNFVEIKEDMQGKPRMIRATRTL